MKEMHPGQSNEQRLAPLTKIGHQIRMVHLRFHDRGVLSKESGHLAVAEPFREPKDYHGGKCSGEEQA